MISNRNESLLPADFEAERYRSANPDVDLSGLDPRTHFERYGRLLNRDPAPFAGVDEPERIGPDKMASNSEPFDADLYARTYPDVSASGLDPQTHYLRYGRLLGRKSSLSRRNLVASVNIQNKLLVSKWNASHSDPEVGAVGYWARQLVADTGHLDWFIATATKTKSVIARDVLTYAVTMGRMQRYGEFEVLLERLRVHNLEGAHINTLKTQFWTFGLRRLARLLYTQRLSPLDLMNSLSIYRFIIRIGDEKLLDDIDGSYYADLLVDHRALLASARFLDARPSRNAQRRVSRRFLRLNCENPNLPGGPLEPEKWLYELNKIYVEGGFAPLCLIPGGDRPFFRLHCEVPRVKGDIPLVSVIMPIYEPDKATDLAIASLLNQSWYNIEVIAVDDCSPATDAVGRPTDYRARLQAWEARDPRFRAIFNPTNRGAYFARNTGYDLAKGKYLTIADKDDWHHPQKIELQAKQMEEEPERVANMVNWVRVTEDLRFLPRWGPDRVVCPSFASLFFRLDILREKFGYWDDVRKSADGEMKFRLQAVYDVDIQPEEPLPLAFSLMGPDNLTSQDLGFGFEDDDRRAYYLSYTSWHKKIKCGAEPARLPRASEGRRFPAPNKFLPEKPEYGSFDLIILSEFGFEAGNSTILRNELKTASAAGLVVGIIPCFNFLIRSASVRHMAKPIQDMLDEGLITRLPIAAAVNTKLLIVRWPSIMQVPHGGRSGVQADHVAVIANHAPYEKHGNRVSYDVTTVSQNIDQVFGKRPLWFPESEQVSGVLAELIAPGELSETPWKGIVAGPLPRVRDPDFSKTAVVGRHGRDHPMKWPGDRASLISAYPIDGRFEVEILGGALSPVKEGLVSAEEISHWRVHQFNAVSVEEYLVGLDFFVYYHHVTLLEAFGMAIVEAMAHGCVCILPENFESVFGDAAIYCSAAEAPNQIREIWGNPGRYLYQQRRARIFVDSHASPAAYLRRLERFGIKAAMR